MLSVVLYSVFTAACGLATTFAQFVIFRISQKTMEAES